MKLKLNFHTLILAGGLVASGAAIWNFSSAPAPAPALAAPARAPKIAQNVVFPADARIVNVKEAPYNAKGDGKTDDTAAIQKALNDHPAAGAIIYLPDGTYLISNTLLWPKGSGGGYMKETILQGQSEAGTVLRLQDNAKGFDNREKSRNMIYTGGPPAQRFRNSIRNLTVDCGAGNAGAIGASYYSNNEGNMRDVTIRSGADGKSPGFVGLDMSTDEVGPQLISEVTVIGFDIGIRTGASVNSITMEHINLRGQREVGFLNRQNLSFVRDLQSQNSVTAVRNEGDDGVLTLLDSDLQGTGAAAQAPAIVNASSRGLLFARNIKTAGYAQALKAGDVTLPVGPISEWSSQAPIGLFANTQLRSLNLPVLDTPDIAFDDPKKWATPLQFGGNPDDTEDDTEAIQKAIDSGATTIYLPRGVRYRNKQNENGAYFLSDTLVLRGKAQRIIGLEARLRPMPNFAAQADKPIFRVEEGTGPVLLERMAMDYGKWKQQTLVNSTKRTIIVKDFSEMHGMQISGGGDFFAENVVGRNWKISNGSRMWGRQINLEGGGMKITNDGAQVWILGLKTECAGPMILTKGGGKTEVLGALFYSCVADAAKGGLFFVEDGQFAIAGAGENVWTRSWASDEVLNETRNGETRSLTKDEMPRRGSGSMIGLVSTLTAPAKGAAPQSAQVAKTDATATTITLDFKSTDPDGDLAGFRVLRDGQPVGHYTEGQWRDSGLKPGTEYLYQVAPYDAFNQQGKPVEFKAATVPDTIAPMTPGNLRAGRVIDRSAQIMWNGSKDEVGVVGYELQRLSADGKVELNQKMEGRELNDAKVVPGTTVTYQVAALDAAGNKSAPAKLEVKIPANPPTDQIVELEQASSKSNTVVSSWYLGNLYDYAWATYKNVELGRTKPFTQMTLSYAIPNDRAGAEVDVYLDATVKGKDVTGTLLGTFKLEGTGDWEKMRDVTLPVTIDKPGEHTLAIQLRRANSKVGNALGNLDKLVFTYGK